MTCARTKVDLRSQSAPVVRRIKHADAVALFSRCYGPGMTSELRDFRAELDGLRGGFLKKVAGLSEVDARRSTVDSGTNLAGLLQHLTFVESFWFEEIAAGGKATGTRSMQVDPATSVRTLKSGYRAACQTSNRVLEALGNLDATVTRHGKTTTCDGCCSQSLQKRLAMPVTPTSSASRSTAKPVDDPGPTRQEGRNLDARASRKIRTTRSTPPSSRVCSEPSATASSA